MLRKADERLLLFALEQQLWVANDICRLMIELKTLPDSDGTVLLKTLKTCEDLVKRFRIQKGL